MKVPAPKKLVDNVLEITGGNCGINKINNEMIGLTEATLATNRLTRDAASSNKVIASMTHNSAKTAELPSFARMVFPAGLGKIFAPLSGN